MGLLQKADSLTRKSVSPKGGLLKRTLQILEKIETEERTVLQTEQKQSETRKAETASKTQAYVSQEEIDRLLNENNKRREYIQKNLQNWKKHKRLPTIPLTWAEANKEAPSTTREPTIKEEDIETLLKNREKEGTKDEKTDRESAESSDIDFTDKLNLLHRKIEEISESIETPIMIFSQLKDFFSIKKGAILLYDPLRMVFAPWASIGYDKTTLHRLRIPLGFSESFNSIANGELTIVQDNLNEYKNFFSNREFNLITKLIFVPFIFNEKLIAILIIQEIAGNKITQENLMSALKTLSPIISQKIYNAREKKLKLLKVMQPEEFETIREKIQNDIKRAQTNGKKVIALLLSLENIINTIPQDILIHSDRYRISEDIEKILKSLFYSAGRVFKLNNFNYLIDIFNMKNPDVELILDQTLYNLNYFLTDKNARLDLKQINYKYKTFPDEAKTESELLSDLI